MGEPHLGIVEDPDKSLGLCLPHEMVTTTKAPIRRKAEAVAVTECDLMNPAPYPRPDFPSALIARKEYFGEEVTEADALKKPNRIEEIALPRGVCANQEGQRRKRDRLISKALEIVQLYGCQHSGLRDRVDCLVG
nr:hypothetical protein [Thiocapsa sp.]